MGLYMTNFIVIVSISGVLHVLLGLFAYYKRRDFLEARTFITIAATSAIYIFGYALELTSSSLPEISFWIKVEYLGLPFIAPTSLIMFLHFVGLGKLASRRNRIFLFIIPALTALLSTTNDMHHLHYREIYLRANTPSPVADIIIGPWYIVHGSFTFGCLLACVCILLSKWRKMIRGNLWQMIALLTGSLLPMAASFSYLMGFTLYGMDPVPVVMCLTALLYMWAIWSKGMLRAAPLARESLFENMQDGVLIVDTGGRLIDFNPAVWSMTGNFASSVIGKPVAQLVEPVSKEAAAFIRESVPAMQSEQKVTWDNRGQLSYYLLRSSPVLKRDGRFIGRIIQLVDMTEQTVLQEKLRVLATTDGLTQIFNRSYFMEKSREALELCSKQNIPLSFILFDIDHFKKINDRYGHNLGDAALRHIVAVCSRHLEEPYLFGRYGGEEFVLCTPGLSLLEAGKLADEIRKDIAQSPLESSSGLISITSSFGVAEFSEDEHTLEELLSQADQALYASKHGGRNRVHLTRSSPMRMFWQI